MDDNNNYEKPPPIPGMRPPLGSPGGPVPAPKSSMGFVMPIYTICIIVFFVYTLSKILFKRTGPSPYETITPDPQFRRRVFRDDSRTTPDKLVVAAISGLVAEVQQQMDANYAQSQQRQDAQDNARPYTNGTILHNSGPVHIVASEYQEATKEKSPEVKESTPEPKESVPESEPTIEPKESSPEPRVSTPEPETILEPEESTPDPKESTPEPAESNSAVKEFTPEPKEATPEIDIEATVDNTEEEPEVNDLIKLTDNLGVEKNEDVLTKSTEEFLREESKISALEKTIEEKQSTPDLLEEAIKEDSPEVDDEVDQDNASVKVVGMEITAHSADGGSLRAPLAAPQPAAPTRPAHEAEQVQSIYLETEIPQKSRVLVTEFAEDKIDKPTPARDSPMVVSGKMTLSLIQDAPEPEPERDPESTVDDFTTASAVTQNAAEKEDDLSDDEEIEEEIEIEEIEEEVSEEEVEVEESDEEVPKKVQQKTGPGNE